jgi:hypothetical protein
MYYRYVGDIGDIGGRNVGFGDGGIDDELLLG